MNERKELNLYYDVHCSMDCYSQNEADAVMDAYENDIKIQGGTISNLRKQILELDKALGNAQARIKELECNIAKRVKEMPR